MIVLQTPTTIYKSREAAEKIAAANQADDNEATYKVEPYAGGYCIAVYAYGERVIRL